MITDTIISGVTKYFTSHSVNSIQGYKKVSLLEIDEDKNATGFKVTIDATTTASVSISKQVMSHASESRKVYTDGTKINPMKMNISGHIDVKTLLDIQRMANDDVWLYVYMSKDMGGAYFSGTRPPKKLSAGLSFAEESTDTIHIPKPVFEYESGQQAWSDCTIYVIKSLTIKDEGFKNTVAVDIELNEVVLFEYDIKYKFGTNSGTKKTQNSGTHQQTSSAPGYDTNIKLVGERK